MSTQKKKIITFIQSVSEILYTYDPADLIKLGIPNDEYDSEAKEIISRLSNINNIESLKFLVYEVMELSIGKDNIKHHNNKCYQYIAERVWDLWQSSFYNVSPKD